MLAYEQWRQLHADGKLNAVQSQFFEPKAAEALYDLDTDPHETHNLAGDAQYAQQLAAMRGRLTERLKAMPDLSFVPEAVLFDEAMENAVAFGQTNKQAISELIDTVNLALLPFDEAKPKLTEALGSEDPWTRYWALVACSSFGMQASSLLPLAERKLVDLEPLVVMRAVEFVAIAGDKDPRSSLYRSFQRATNEPEALRMMNTAVFLNDFSDGRLPIDVEKIDFLFEPGPRSEIVRRLEYLAR